jgi:hypothetical protein
MRYIELDNTLPNQRFSFKTDNGTVDIELRTIDNMTLMSISSNGTNIINSIKVAPNVPLIGYKYIQEQYGDFIFTTVDNEYPYFLNFNNANKLYWLSYEEVQRYNE